MSNTKEQVNKTPNQPGIYQFKDKSGNLLYIGKAKDLKKRVRSYFNKNNQDTKTTELVKKIVKIDFIITKNEVEALLLEASLIRKNQPPYNIDLKGSSNRYAYLKITDEKFPKITVIRNERKKKAGKIFGPYTSAQTRKEAQYWANAIFKLRTCNKLPKQACLLYYINLCSAPCVKKISEQDYQDNIKKAERFLRGEINELKEELVKEMKQFSSEQKYEIAKIRRDQIMAIEKIKERQNIDLPKGYNQDVFHYVVTKSEMIVQLFNIKRGLISERKEFKIIGNDFAEFLRRYYDTREIPEEIILPAKLKDGEVLEKYFSKVKGKRVKIIIPKQGSKKELLNLLQKNLDISARVGNVVLNELQQKLNLPVLPKVIEMFDISHTDGTEIVASMVQFADGQPNKSNYRKFKIKTVKDNDDFASMKEVVRRRYQKPGIEFPDLIAVDGGRGQLSVALGVLQELGLNIPLIALAKKEEEIYTVGRRFPVCLPKNSASLKLLQRIRDEAHRFAITFHRQRRSKRLLKK